MTEVMVNGPDDVFVEREGRLDVVPKDIVDR
jgi:Flp pilus assembly CpaF family ATPase